MGRTVSELMSANITNAITSQQTWGNVLIIANSYGAKGDGSTDSTAAIQQAITAAKAAGKSEVYFLPGDYVYTTLTNTDGIVFWGDGVTVSGSPAIPVVSTAQSADIALSVKSFGAVGDGVADDTAAIQAAWDAAHASGRLLYFPPGTYRITAAIGINTTLTASNSPPSVHGAKAMAVGNNVANGVQNGSIILYDGAGSAFQIKNSSNTEFFYGGEIRNLTILKKDGDKSTDGSVGFDIKGWVDFRLYNVVCIGFEIGLASERCWSWDAFGLTCVRNDYGVVLGDNSNAVRLFGVQAHQNNVGIRIKHGINIKIDGATVEGQAHGIVISKGSASQGIAAVTLNNIYGEANTTSLIRIGQDEDGVQSSAAVLSVSMDTVYPIQNPGTIVPVQLDNVENVKIKNIIWGQPTDFISVTAATRYVTVDNYNNQYEAAHIGNRYSVSQRLGVKNSVNLLPGGFLNLPDLSHFNKAGVTAAYDSLTFAGERVIKLTIPNSTTTNECRLGLRVDRRMVGKRMIFHGTAQKDDAANFGAFFIFYNPAFGGITGGTASMPTAMSTVQRNFIVPDEDYIWFTLFVNNTSGSTKYAYIKNFVLIDQNTGTVETNPLDYAVCLSGSVAATTGGTAVAVPGFIAELYNVLVSPYGNVTAYAVPGTGSFTVYTVGGDEDCAYWVVPKFGHLY